jgi:2-C-methyl-D-erythritol 4-phosphate cytidylyltransferase/2-C-methyl-D-erythritol 2,4-cyclodiphosphate synthase
MPDSPPSIWLLLTAAGSSSRFGGNKKELATLDGMTVIAHACRAFLHLPQLEGILVTHPEGMKDVLRDSLLSLPGLDRFELRFEKGGTTRQESVVRGLRAIAASVPAGTDPVVLIHDAARPWASAGLVDAVLAGTLAHDACIPLVPLADTPKVVGSDGFIKSHPERSTLEAAQTPQGFRLKDLLDAHEKAAMEGWSCTDDASVWDRYRGPVAHVRGERSNRKITWQEDLPMAETHGTRFRIGEGWDIHPLVAGRRLLLGGVHIEHARGEAGHSDGDVLWHAIMDSLLGAAGLGDIGTHFPPSDMRWKDADSGELAAQAALLLAQAGWQIENIDCTIILERPRLSAHKHSIRESIAARLGIDPGSVSVKAKTNEGFGELGRGEAVEARAVALIARRTRDMVTAGSAG